MDDVPNPRYKCRNALKKTKGLSRDELIERIRLVPNGQAQAYCCLNAIVGLRISEVCAFQAKYWTYECPKNGCKTKRYFSHDNKERYCPKCKRRNLLMLMERKERIEVNKPALKKEQIIIDWNERTLTIINCRILKRRGEHTVNIQYPITDVEEVFAKELQRYLDTLVSPQSDFVTYKRCAINRYLNKAGLHSHYLRRYQTNSLIHNYRLEAASVKEQKHWASVMSFDHYHDANTQVTVERMRDNRDDILKKQQEKKDVQLQ